MQLTLLDPKSVALTGIAEMDAQHARLVALLNRLVTWCNKDMEIAATFDAVRELTEYAKTHFRSEEQYLREHGYPAYDEHQLRHRNIEREFAELTRRIYDGQDATLELVEFVRAWIMTHIAIDDMEYGSFFRSGATNS